MISHDVIREAAGDVRTAWRSAKSGLNQMAEALGSAPTGSAPPDGFGALLARAESLERQAKQLADDLFTMANRLKAEQE